MKDIRGALRTILASDPAVNALCAGRIYPVRLKQGDRGPSIVYHRVTALFDYEMDGPSGLVQSLMQIDSVAALEDAATQLGNAVHDVLTGFRGQVLFGSNSPQTSITIHGIFNTTERDVFDSVTEMVALQRDYQIWYWE
jgi:hypothetical protein